MIREILKLGEPSLYQVSGAVSREELADIRPVVEDLHDTMMEFRRVYGCGRAIAAPQIGVFKRILYMHVERPVAFLNPVLEFPQGEKIQVMDDCMCFPNLLVRVERYRTCVVHYRDMEWREQSVTFTDDLSELIQHEYDHLDGILATMRAMDDKSFYLKK